jgi:hypothetical protein
MLSRQIRFCPILDLIATLAVDGDGVGGAFVGAWVTPERCRVASMPTSIKQVAPNRERRNQRLVGITSHL